MFGARRLYCKHAEKTFGSPEDELLFFLNKTKSARWKWKGRTAVSPEHAVYCKFFAIFQFIK